MTTNNDFKNVCWRKEFEEFTSIYPDDTGLEVKLMLDDCNAAGQSGHPVVVFMQNSYDQEDFDAKLPLSADADARNIFNMRVNIRHRDYVGVRLWVMRHWKLLGRLSRMEIDMFGFKRELEDYRYDNTDDSLNESLDESALFEMAILKGNITGLDYDIWIDNDQTWRESGHSPRLKVQDSNRSSNTRQWNPFIFDTMDYADACKKDTKRYPARARKSILEFIAGNKDLLIAITCGENKMTDDEIKKQILTIDEIRNGVTRESRDEHVIQWKKYLDIGCAYGYAVGGGMREDGTMCYAVITADTHRNVFGDRVFAAVMPMARADQNGLYVLVYPIDSDSTEAEKLYLPKN